MCTWVPLQSSRIKCIWKDPVTLV